MSICHCGSGRGLPDQLLGVDREALVAKLPECILLLDFWVEDVNQGTVIQQHVANFDGWCLTHVARVLLESETEHGDLLGGDSVEKTRDDVACEGVFPVIVHVHHALPIAGDIMQALRLTNVNEIEDVLLKAPM